MKSYRLEDGGFNLRFGKSIIDLRSEYLKLFHDVDAYVHRRFESRAFNRIIYSVNEMYHSLYHIFSKFNLPLELEQIAYFEDLDDTDIQSSGAALKAKDETLN